MQTLTIPNNKPVEFQIGAVGASFQPIGGYEYEDWEKEVTCWSKTSAVSVEKAKSADDAFILGSLKATPKVLGQDCEAIICYTGRIGKLGGKEFERATGKLRLNFVAPTNFVGLGLVGWAGPGKLSEE